ncbi:spore germination protein [Neobacillus sp. OS1-2]|uniref:spore germination protein n=1 Tax=Neobacillus sp. OS1-2 TaxID=3070680 RepID=UPI0027E1985C|nr:spore germination protein [Neobacillus sp. OS1-2]WML38127.1 spore germination protein [Neobacillus sp. OS1-2]
MNMHQATSKVPYINELKSWFEGSSDIVMTKRTYKEKGSPVSLEFLYCSNLVDMKYINEVIFPCIHTVVEVEDDLNIDQLRNLIEVSGLKDKKNVKTEVEQKLFSGELIIFSYKMNELFFIPASAIPKRSPEESNLEPSVRGPRDGFVENISDNLALIHQRLKTSSLKSIEYTVGERSRTKLILLYIDDIMNPSILENVKKRLESIKIDIVVSSYEIEEHLYDKVFSIFPLTDYIGRPDFAVQSLNQGRFVVLVEGNPTCLIGPTNFNQILYSPEDVHESFFYTSLVRILRLTAVFATVYLPGFYIALITYQIDQVPYSLLATITVSRLGLPLPAAAEALIMLILFELFKEGGLRLPKAVGQTVAVLGGLIIGDAAIRAGLTSPTMLVIIAITVLSGYTLINQNLAGNIAILRFIVLLFSGFLGLLGFFVSFFLITTLVVSLESFGEPYVSYLSKPHKMDIIKNFIMLPSRFRKKRNQAYSPIDSDSQKE